MTHINNQYTKMQELRSALPATLTQGVYDDEARFCSYVAGEHPDAVRSTIRVPGTDEQDTWVNAQGEIVAIWNSQFQVGATVYSNQFPRQQQAACLMAA